MLIVYYPLIVGYNLLIVGYYLLIVGYYLLIVGYYLLIVGYVADPLLSMTHHRPTVLLVQLLDSEYPCALYMKDLV